MKRTLLIGFILMMAALICGSALLAWQLVTQHLTLEHLSTELLRVMDLERRLTNNLNRVQSELYRLSEGEQRYADQLIDAVESSEQVLRELSRHYTLASQVEIHDRLSQKMDHIKQLAGRMVTTDDKALYIRLAQESLRESIHMREEVGTLRDKIAAHAQEDLAKSGRIGKSLVLSFVVVFWVVVILFLFIMRRAFVFLEVGMAGLIEGAQRIAHGEFGYRIDLPSAEEIQKLGGAMNTMAENLAKAKENRVSAVRQLVGRLSHDFNNRVSAILGLAECMKRRRCKDDPELAEKLTEIQLNAKQISASLHRLNNVQQLATIEYWRGVRMLDIEGAGADNPQAPKVEPTVEPVDPPEPKPQD